MTGLFNKVQTSLEYVRLKKMEERLKKRIKELENKKYEAFEQIILDELQKILERKDG